MELLIFSIGFVKYMLISYYFNFNSNNITEVYIDCRYYYISNYNWWIFIFWENNFWNNEIRIHWKCEKPVVITCLVPSFQPKTVAI